jgi:hypothetical protein
MAVQYILLMHGSETTSRREVVVGMGNRFERCSGYDPTPYWENDFDE